MKNKNYTLTISLVLWFCSVALVSGQTVAVYNIDVQFNSNFFDPNSIKWNSDDFNRESDREELAGIFENALKEKMNYKTVFINVPKYKAAESKGIHFKRAANEDTKISIERLPCLTIKEAKKEFGNENPDEYMEVTVLFKYGASASNLVVLGKQKKAGYISYNVEVTILSKNAEGVVIKEKKYTCVDFSEVLPGMVEKGKTFKTECDGMFTREIILKSLKHAFTQALLK